MNRSLRSQTFLVLLCGALLAAAAGAQEHPNLARGFESGKQYDFGSVDSVNLFTGGLSLTLPIGNSYPVNGALSYSLSLVYHSNVWDYQIRRDAFENPFVQASPRESANAGMGWHLSLGRFYYPQSPGNNTGKWVYMGPDGGRHSFYATLHEGETAVANVCYTRDASYLRLTGVGACNTNTTTLAAEIEFPDGTIHRFTRTSSALPFQLAQIRDRFNNQLNLSYAVANQWQISDGHRTHRVIFATQPSGMTVIDRVELAAFNGATAVYDFNYVDVSIQRSCKDNDAQTSPTLTVSLLASVTLPEGLSYSMLDAGGVNPAYNTTCDTTLKDLSGTIQRFTVPTKGVIEWTYRQYRFVDSLMPFGPLEDQITFGYGTGIATKSVKEPNGTCYGGGASCTWTYVPQGSGQAPFERKMTVTSPLGDDTVYHFDENPERRLGHGWEYGLPMKRSVSDGAGRFLSQEIYDGPVAGGVRKRTVYVRYDKDKLPSSTLADGYHNTNRRLESQRVVYDDDPGRFADIDYSNFDGLGHYRMATTGGNFGAGDVRTTFTGYNRDPSGIYRVFRIDPATNNPAPEHNFVLPGTGAPWVLGTFAEQTVSEGGATARSEYCFDAGTGFMLRKRILASGTVPGATDVLVVRAPSADGRGNLGSEEWSGGDTQTVPTTDLCSLAPPANQYRLSYTYQFGSMSTAQYQGFTFRTVDNLIDANTGLARQSLDTASLAINFEYDLLGRLTWEKPTAGHGAWMQHIHTPATAGALAQEGIHAWPNGTVGGQPALSAVQVRFDRFGRLAQERQLMPGGANNYSTRETRYNALGWKTSVSELGSTGSVTSYLNYDPFGRPATLRPPDGSAHDVSFTYTGVRSVSRTVRIGTAWNGTVVTESPATTTEIYDRQGRLQQVIEPAEGATATYGYNVLGLLASVTQTGSGTQTRLFNYDNRGFLTSERHPEKGVNGNGTVSYLSYDARGHAGRRLDGPNDLSFIYDRAERLTKVYKTGTPTTCTAAGARCLKAFTFADSNVTGSSRKGKLIQAERWNYPFLGGTTHTVVVTELYTYGGKDGRVSQKESRLAFNGTTNEFFFQSYAYDDVGQVTSLSYPNCAFAACTSSPRTVSFGYNNGRLTSVPGYAGTVSYHANGLLNQVVHANGVTFTQGNDPNGIPRPASMTAVNAFMTTLWTAGAHAYDGTGSLKTIGGQRFLYDLVGRVVEGRTPDGQSQLYTYNAHGSVTSINTSGSLLNTPTSGTTNHLGAPSSYDGAGNLLSYGGSQYEYDELNMLKHFTSGAEEWLYMYTATDERFWSFKVGANPRFDRFTLRDLDGRILREYANSGYTFGTYQDYVYRGDKLLASVLSSGAVRHFDVDHLGSVRLVTDAGGAQLGFHRYFPFGKENTALQEGERMKFAGHERDLGNLAGDADDLDYMHARHFNPLNARFLSIDVAGGDPRNPQSWNRYAYVLGNPLKYTDPRGLLPDDPVAEFSETITVVDGKPGTQSTGMILNWYAAPRPAPFLINAGRGESLTRDDFARAVAQGVWQRTGWLSEAADDGARVFDYATGYISAVDALVAGDPREAGVAVLFAVIPGPIDNAGHALVRTGLNISEHAAGRMAQYGVSKAMVNATLRKGVRYWDPKNKSVVYVLKEGFASGKSLAVAINPVTGGVNTVMTGWKVVKSRFVPLP
jgi:RHS repeat-associated protein